MDHVTYVSITPTGDQFLLTEWADGTRELATRPHPGATWGPPVTLVRQSGEVSG